MKAIEKRGKKITATRTKQNTNVPNFSFSFSLNQVILLLQVLFYVIKLNLDKQFPNQHLSMLILKNRKKL
jgi:23S rRNA maturation mini-RNase III